MQDTIYAGDTLNYPAAVPSYPATSGWTLKLRVAPLSGAAGGGAATTFTATASGADYLVTVPAAVTATWAAGRYSYAVWVEKAGERYTQATGQLTVLADGGAMAGGTDTRTHAQKVLDAVEAVLEGRASQAQAEYEIAGRKVKYLPMGELLNLRDRYRAEVRAQRAAAAGLPGGQLLVRL